MSYGSPVSSESRRGYEILCVVFHARCRRAAARFTARVLGEHLRERIEQILAGGGEILEAASAFHLAAPMACGK